MTEFASKRPKPGTKVVLTDVPPGLQHGLPEEDQQAIAEAVGKPVLLNQYGEDGRAELQFTDKEGVIHFIYVNPTYIKRAD